MYAVVRDLRRRARTDLRPALGLRRSECHLPEPGAYLVAEVAGESVVVLRDTIGTARAFFNVCRHRGTRLLETAAGRLSRSIQCPYHAWTYALDGQLIGAPHVDDVVGFEKSDYPLHPVALQAWEGFLFANLRSDPEPLPNAFAPLRGPLPPFRHAQPAERPPDQVSIPVELEATFPELFGVHALPGDPTPASPGAARTRAVRTT